MEFKIIGRKNGKKTVSDNPENDATVEIGISLRFDKKYFGRSHFRFVIFSLV